MKFLVLPLLLFATRANAIGLKCDGATIQVNGVSVLDTAVVETDDQLNVQNFNGPMTYPGDFRLSTPIRTSSQYDTAADLYWNYQGRNPNVFDVTAVAEIKSLNTGSYLVRVTISDNRAKPTAQIHEYTCR